MDRSGVSRHELEASEVALWLWRQSSCLLQDLVARKGNDIFLRSPFTPPVGPSPDQSHILLRVASDDAATLYLNAVLLDRDPLDEHKYIHWNREVRLSSEPLRVG